MNETLFDFYYSELVKLMNPRKEEELLNYGGMVKLHISSLKIDLICTIVIREKMLQNAISNFGLNSCICDELVDKNMIKY